VPIPPTMAPGSMMQSSVTAPLSELQPSAPPPSHTGDQHHDGTADPSAAQAALPAANTSMGVASPPLHGREVPAVMVAEQPTTAPISSSGAGGLSSPPSSQRAPSRRRWCGPMFDYSS
jgi:hypothetical protein